MRFALAQVQQGRVVDLSFTSKQRVEEHPTFELAWAAYIQQLGRPAPRAASIALACPINDSLIKLTNNPWVFRPSLIHEQLDIDHVTFLNDFAAIGHSVAQLPDDMFQHLCGPATPLPQQGAITICGPGTGLGVAQIFRPGDGSYHVIPTEGGHIDFAPIDGIDDEIVRTLRPAFSHVSAERVVAGPGIVAIYQALGKIEGQPIVLRDDKSIWDDALAGNDPLAVAAMDRFCMSLGSLAGSLALAHGPSSVVIAGGLALRLKDHLPVSGFADRFTAKGRFQQLMSTIPVKLITYEEPGLFGAAAAFAQQHTRS